jgi:hypothetical protein
MRRIRSMAAKAQSRTGRFPDFVRRAWIPLCLVLSLASACKPTATPVAETRQTSEAGFRTLLRAPAPAASSPRPLAAAPDAAAAGSSHSTDAPCRRSQRATDLCAALRQVVEAGRRDEFRSLACRPPSTTGWVPARVALPGSAECLVQVGMYHCTMRPSGTAQRLAESLACCQPGWLVQSEPWGANAPDASFTCLLGVHADGRPTVECYVEEHPEAARGALVGYHPACARGAASAPSVPKRPASTAASSPTN